MEANICGIINKLDLTAILSTSLYLCNLSLASIKVKNLNHI